MSEAVEPLPCPFCQQPPDIIELDSGECDVQCFAQPCVIAVLIVTGKDRATAIDKWNTRIAPNASAAKEQS